MQSKGPVILEATRSTLTNKYNESEPELFTFITGTLTEVDQRRVPCPSRSGRQPEQCDLGSEQGNLIPESSNHDCQVWAFCERHGQESATREYASQPQSDTQRPMSRSKKISRIQKRINDLQREYMEVATRFLVDEFDMIIISRYPVSLMTQKVQGYKKRKISAETARKMLTWLSADSGQGPRSCIFSRHVRRLYPFTSHYRHREQRCKPFSARASAHDANLNLIFGLENLEYVCKRELFDKLCMTNSGLSMQDWRKSGGKRQRKLTRRNLVMRISHQDEEVIMEEAEALCIEIVLAYGDACFDANHIEKQIHGEKTRHLDE
ncbi:hypothetical protein O0I10_010285 [Lichtheimia ornata]|uniref:Uncharacterized protein n=1 Tax=Lichtheimia ornata TaxID=688661 RepID=A0AAD7UWD9_9FUNG|nr:uncharacterized protein O0I10_010285 [Lichtheimia ornata]KAJ8654074.1 hypothetical protein O0I10_010285 [Lichtheimia ornata]